LALVHYFWEHSTIEREVILQVGFHHLFMHIKSAATVHLCPHLLLIKFIDKHHKIP
jgi:hypothetical protein